MFEIVCGQCPPPGPVYTESPDSEASGKGVKEGRREKREGTGRGTREGKNKEGGMGNWEKMLRYEKEEEGTGRRRRQIAFKEKKKQISTAIPRTDRQTIQPPWRSLRESWPRGPDDSRR